MSITATTARQRERVRRTLGRVHRRVLQEQVAQEAHTKEPTAQERLCQSPVHDTVCKAVERITRVAPVLRNGNRSASPPTISPPTISGQLDSDVSRRVSPVAERQGYGPDSPVSKLVGIDGQPLDLDIVTREHLAEEAEIDLEESTAKESGRSLTIADVFWEFSPEYRRRIEASSGYPRDWDQQDRALRELMGCRTPIMGTHEWSCQECGTTIELCNSCVNRHCPTCGYAKRQAWAANVESMILPVQYQHVILTLPGPLTKLAFMNRRVLYAMMMRCCAWAILKWGEENLQAQMGVLALLHTWGNLLNQHIHSHIMLASGGLSFDHSHWIDLTPELLDKLLEALETEFRNLFIKQLEKAHAKGELEFRDEFEYLNSNDAFEKWLEPMREQTWIVRCPRTWDPGAGDPGAMDDPESATRTIEYLARYADRVAISNSRLLEIDGRDVLFRYKDYRDHDRWKTKRMDGVEFVERFLTHLLPKYFWHIRRSGFMGPKYHRERVAQIRTILGSSKSTDAVDALLENEDSEITEEKERVEDNLPACCRDCSGKLTMTYMDYRPTIAEIMRMPLNVIADACKEANDQRRREEEETRIQREEAKAEARRHEAWAMGISTSHSGFT